MSTSAINTPPAPQDMRAATQQIVRYGVSGIANTIVGFIIYAGAVLLTPCPFWLANFFAMVGGIISGFLLSRFFVFRTTSTALRPGIKSSIGRYVFTIGLQFVLSTGLIALLIQCGLSQILSYIIVLPPVIALSFFLQKLWVFNTVKEVSKAK